MAVSASYSTVKSLKGLKVIFVQKYFHSGWHYYSQNQVKGKVI